MKPADLALTLAWIGLLAWMGGSLWVLAQVKGDPPKPKGDILCDNAGYCEYRDMLDELYSPPKEPK